MVNKPSTSVCEHSELANDEMIRHLLHNSLSALLSGLFVSVLAFIVLAEYYERELATLWLLSYTLTVVLRLITLKVIEKHSQQSRLALHGFTFLSFVSGVCWAALLLFLQPGVPLVTQLFLLVVVCGIPIAGLSSISMYPPVFVAMNLPIFAGLVSWAIFAAPGHNLPFAGLATMYAALLGISAKTYYHNMRDALLARLRNRELVKELSHANQELETLAYRDPVTGLSNRRWFEHELALALQHCEQQGESLALLLIDLDHFKEINDTHGHHIGDQVLRHTARCLSQVLDEPNGNPGHAARYGGDEFLMALIGVPPERAVAIGEDLLRQISATLHFGEVACTPSATIGIAMFPDDAHSVDKLTRHADMAMYAAKKLGRNQLHLYNSTLRLDKGWNEKFTLVERQKASGDVSGKPAQSA